MTNNRIIQIDSVDAYNKLYGWETLHPLVTVVNHANPMASDLNHSRLNYGLYALFLKQGDGCSIRYGREKYDYQEGTVVSFKPGQVVEVEWDATDHADLIDQPLLDRIARQHGTHIIDHAERIGLGSRSYTLIDLADLTGIQLISSQAMPQSYNIFRIDGTPVGTNMQSLDL